MEETQHGFRKGRIRYLYFRQTMEKLLRKGKEIRQNKKKFLRSGFFAIRVDLFEFRFRR
jgi:hypothetical protein